MELLRQLAVQQLKTLETVSLIIAEIGNAFTEKLKYLVKKKTYFEIHNMRGQ